MKQLTGKFSNNMTDIYNIGQMKLMKLLTHAVDLLFIGHYTSENLLGHYKAFAEKMKLDSSFLLHLGMDGPYVNLSFEQKLIDNLNARQVSTS